MATDTVPLSLAGGGQAATEQNVFEKMTGLVESWGYVGIALLMFLENVFPPIPSEIVMPLAGYTAARGDLSIVLVAISGSIGSVAGATLWYVVGAWIGSERLRRIAARHGRWLTLHPDEVDQADRWFDQRGGLAVFIGRLVPGVRTLISVPAGIARMPMSRFLLYTTAGTVIWTSVLAVAGYWLGARYDVVADWIDPVAKVVLIAMLAIYVWRVATFRPAPRP